MRKLIYLLPLLLFVCFGCGESDEESDEDFGGVAEVVSTNPLTGGVSTTQGTQNLPPKGKIDVYLDLKEEKTLLFEGLDPAIFILDQINVKEYGKLMCKIKKSVRAVFGDNRHRMLEDIKVRNQRVLDTFSVDQEGRRFDLGMRLAKVDVEIEKKRIKFWREDSLKMSQFNLDWDAKCLLPD